MSLPEPPNTDRKDLARTFLELANDDYQQRRIHRAYYAKVAKTHGLTNQEIATIYGVTEGAIRQLIKRSAK